MLGLADSLLTLTQKLVLAGLWMHLLMLDSEADVLADSDALVDAGSEADLLR